MGLNAKHNKEASDAALEFSKHLITLSSGVVAVGATFVSHFDTAPRWSLSILLTAWTTLTISVFAGLKTISFIISSRIHDNNDWAHGSAEKWAKVSRWSFLGGIIVFALFASVAMTLGDVKSPAKSAPEVIKDGLNLALPKRPADPRSQP